MYGYTVIPKVKIINTFFNVS